MTSSLSTLKRGAMGCGGSKQDVASGNTVRYRRLLRKKSGAANPTVQTSSSSSSAVPADVLPSEPAPPTPPTAAVADVKDITVNMDGKAGAAGEGNLVDSPDRYFSSRKDDESLDAAATGEYFSPRYEPNGAAGVKKSGGLAPEGVVGTADADVALAGTPKECGGSAAEEQALGGVAVLPWEGNELLNAKVCVDLKEPILVEETKLEVTILEMKNVGVDEILSDPSTQ